PGPHRYSGVDPAGAERNTAWPPPRVGNATGPARWAMIGPGMEWGEGPCARVLSPVRRASVLLRPPQRPVPRPRPPRTGRRREATRRPPGTVRGWGSGRRARRRARVVDAQRHAAVEQALLARAGLS